MASSPSHRASEAPSQRSAEWKAEEVYAHWTRLAESHGSDLQATTKTPTIKRLEVDALVRALRRHGVSGETRASLLEVGCGNGHNAIELARAFPGLRLTGVDYVPAMVEAARARTLELGLADRVDFEVADLRRFRTEPHLRPSYDGILSVRCLINLTSLEEQEAAIEALLERLAPGGLLLLIENSLETHGRQNEYRAALGLPRRQPAPYNRFFDADLVPFLRGRLESLEVEDFASLHDLALYVLGPAILGGQVDYEHPLVQAATELSLSGALQPAAVGACGQNRLFVGRKPRA